MGRWKSYEERVKFLSFPSQVPETSLFDGALQLQSSPLYAENFRVLFERHFRRIRREQFERMNWAIVRYDRVGILLFWDERFISSKVLTKPSLCSVLIRESQSHLVL